MHRIIGHRLDVPGDVNRVSRINGLLELRALAHQVGHFLVPLFDDDGDGLPEAEDEPVAATLDTRPTSLGTEIMLVPDAPLALGVTHRLHVTQDVIDLRGEPLIAMRIGILTGPMVAGTLGSDERIEYNVHGDTVNTVQYRDVGIILRVTPQINDKGYVKMEVHPEVSFWALAGGRPMQHSKKRKAGREERQALVEKEFGDSAIATVRAGFLRRDVADDDILDAFAALWTAGRIAAGRARALPRRPIRDSVGLLMEIRY